MLLRKRRREAEHEKIQQNIRHALDLIRPILRIDDCNLTLSGYESETGVAILSVNGGCSECEVSVETFLQGIETQLKLRVPEVTSVRLS